jgi:hypothetical protein
MRRSRKPFRGRFLRRGFESLPLRCGAKSANLACLQEESSGRDTEGPSRRRVNERQRTSLFRKFIPPAIPPRGFHGASPHACESPPAARRHPPGSHALAVARLTTPRGLSQDRAASGNADRTCCARLALPACLVNLRPEPGGRRVFAKVVAKVGQREVDVAVAC